MLKMLVIVLLQSALVNQFFEIGRSSQLAMICRKLCLKIDLPKQTNILSLAETLFSRTIPTQICVSSANPIV